MKRFSSLRDIVPSLLFTRVLGVILLLALSPVASAQCSPDMNDRAVSSLVEASKSWSSLLQHYETFSVCDDGELGEGYSEAVVQLFAQRWDQFGLFVPIAESNPDFLQWAIRHIDETTSSRDLKQIVQNAERCPSDAQARKICKTIQKNARAALVGQ